MFPAVATGACSIMLVPVQAQVKVWSGHSQVLLPMLPAVATGGAMFPDGATGAAMCPDGATGAAMFPAVATGACSIMLVPVQAQVNVWSGHSQVLLPMLPAVATGGATFPDGATGGAMFPDGATGAAMFPDAASGAAMF